MGFRRNEHGNVAIMVAVLMSVLLLLAGIAIDVGRTVYARSQLQMDMDAAVKAAAAAITLTPDGRVDSSKVASVARAFFKANHTENAALIETTTLRFDPKYRDDATYQDSVVATLDAKVVTAFMKIWGKPFIPLHLEAVAKRPRAPPLELVFVMDVSLSMNDPLPGGFDKAMEARWAAMGLTRYVMQSPYAKVGAVPYAQQVNLSPTFPRARAVPPWPPWLSVGDSYVINDLNCQVNGQTCTQTDSTCQKVDSFETEPCKVTTCTGGTKVCAPRTVAFQGCVNPRLSDSGEPVADISNPTNPKHPGPAGPCVVSPIVPLLSRADEEGDRGMDLVLHILAQVGPGWEMSQHPELGNTFTPVGLIWGWNMLDPEEPLTWASRSTGPDEPNRALVLITDGDNTRWPTPEGWNSSPEAKQLADQLTTRICNNIKTTTNIKIYTVAITIPSATTLDLLQDCASDTHMFFKVDTADQMALAFGQIGKSLANNVLVK